MNEPRRIEVDDRTYQLRPWSYQDGRRWLFKLLAISSGAASAKSEGEALGAILRDIGEQTFVELCGTVEKYTDLVRVHEGTERVVPLSKVAATEMPRRYVDLAMLIRAHLEAEFADFFGRLGEVLEGVVEKAK